jgi:ATP-binding cassette, subfamily F, member 3
MALLTTSNLSKAYGPEDIFDGVTLSIPHRARIGLVGPNGIGKTTLLRILVGEESPSGGQVSRARNLTIGYLPQEARLHSNKTLWKECMAALQELIEMGKRLEKLETAMNDADADKAEAAIASYGSLQMEFERRGGYMIDNRIRQTLEGLGFEDKDFHRPMNKLSGGQRTRAVLARLLLSEPNLLLLDEPTNHLDIAAIEWLEAYLKDWPGAVLIVSHDRYFLNQVVNTILEMTPSIETYRGNYSAYLEQRETRYERRMAEFKSQQAFIEKEEEYIRRNIAGQNTRQAQGRRKRLERMMKDALVAKPITAGRRIHLNLQTGDRSGDLVLRTRELHIGYHDDKKTLFALPDLTLLRGECAAIIGPNGAGKTTFLKTLLEELPPLSGDVRLGANLHIGYFAQAHEDLHPDFTLMEEIDAIAPSMLPAEVRKYLAKFLFTEDDVFKQVSVLSGGERGRLALACLALQGANLLLLDEPTNHLDLAAQEVLQSILADFNGTILLVSHDRYLIDVLGTQIWEVKADTKTLAVFEGTYSEYRGALQVAAVREAEATVETETKVKSQRPRASGMNNRQRRRLRRMETLENEIAELEHELDDLTRQFENPPTDPAAVQQLSEDYADVQRRMDEKLDEWTVLSDKVL